jgi:tetratricopeptide (TPR) repeat protein
VKRRHKGGKPTPAAAPVPAGWKSWQLLLAFCVAAAAALEVYSPTLRGPFLLDDLYLPFMNIDAGRLDMRVWLGMRPALMITYWLNYQLSGTEPYSYHVVNVVLHVLTAAAVFVIARRMLERAGEPEARRDLLSALAAGVFLLHPVQTEAVGYVASRSDLMCTLFACLALVVFLGQGDKPIGFGRSGAVLALTACAALSKQQAMALPAVFLLLDYFEQPESGWEGIKENWRLHAPMLGGGAAGAVAVLRMLRSERSAGFGVEEFTWYEYFYTQCRVIWRYVRLLVLPVGQNVDPDYAISRSLLDHLSWLGLAGLLILICGAWWARKRYPLAAVGVLVFLALLAPTSSFIPIKDVAAERRVYFAMIGFLLVALEAARRWRSSATLKAATLGSLLAALGWGTYQRSQVWESPLALWRDTVEKSPAKYRPRFQLAYALYQAEQCEEASSEFATAATLQKPDEVLLVDWALALDCAGHPEEAMEKLRQALVIEDSGHIRAVMGMVYGKQGRSEEALRELDEAERRSPGYAIVNIYRGNVFAAGGDWEKAREQYRLAVKKEPTNPSAAQALGMAESRLRGQ